VESLSSINLSACTPQESKLCIEVIQQVLTENSYQFIYPQYVFQEESGKTRRIDFAIVSQNSKIAIELDGYTYHAEGIVTPDKFSDDLQRQNELSLAGWTIIRFSWRDVVRNPEKCKDILRRTVISDPQLHPSLGQVEIEPHVIQQEALSRLENARKMGARKGLVVMATGLGKTYLSAFDAKQVGGKILFIVHNNSILEQSREAFARVFPERSTGLYNGYEKTTDKDILFANINTLRTHFKLFEVTEFNYIIVDEFHHGVNYQSVLSYFKPSFLLGLTATPNRTDQRSILSLVDENLVFEMNQKQAIERGFLTPFHYFALKDNVDYSNIQHNGFRYNINDLNRALIIKTRDDVIIEKFKELAGSEKSIAFCVSIEHAKRAAGHFNDAGIPSIAIHSGMSNLSRNEKISDFRNGKYQVVFVRDIFNEGIDFPEVGSILFMRPTESKIIFTQQLGRGLRLCAGKKEVIVLDFIGNYINADKLIDYLGSYGTEISLEQVNGEKPTYYFDNGCRIEFEQAAVDLIIKLNRNIIAEDALIRDFYLLCKKLGKAPSIIEIQLYGMYKICNYLERYGDWNTFLERIIHLSPELDISSLEWPAKFKDIEVQEYADMIDSDSSQFMNLLLDSVNSLESIKLRFNTFGKERIRGFNKKLHHIRITVRELTEETKLANELLEQICIILSYKFNMPINLQEPTDQPQEQILNQMKLVTNLLIECIDLRESYIFPKVFVNKIPLIDHFFKLVSSYTSIEMTEELLTLDNIYAYGLKVNKFVTEIKKYCDIFSEYIINNYDK